MVTPLPFNASIAASRVGPSSSAPTTTRKSLEDFANSLTLLWMRLLSVIAIVAGVFSFSAAPAVAEISPAPQAGAEAAFLYDLEGSYVLWSHAPEKLLPPASLAKLVTALVVADHGDLGSQAIITPEARNAEGTRLYAEQGWSFSLEDLLWSLLLNSANDASVAAAQATSPDGTIESFTRLMDAKAKEVGATSSTFGDPTGLDHPGTRSTAKDMALIAAAVIEHPLLSEIVATRTHDIPWGDGSTKTLINQNKLLGQLDGAIGVKTGFTDDAGRTMIAAARRGGTTLISVMLDVSEPTASSGEVLEWGFANLAGLRAASPERVERLAPEPSHGLEVVVVQDGTPAGAWGLPPMLGPLAALAVAFLFYRFVKGSAQRRTPGRRPRLRGSARA